MVIRSSRHRCPLLLVVLTLLILSSALPPPAAAQTGAPALALQAEYDIGFDCPVSAALDTTGVLWVLMDNCFNYQYTLRGFGVEDGSPVPGGSADDFAVALADLEEGLPWYTAMAFTPDGALDILYSAYSAPQTYDIRNLRLGLRAEAPADTRAVLPTLPALEALIPGFAGYPEVTVYSADHTRAVVVEETRFTIIDLQAGEILLTMDIPAGTYGSFPAFTGDGQLLAIARLNDRDDYNTLESTLTFYSLPGGEEVASIPVPTPYLWLSPDRRTAAALLDSDTLIAIDLTSGNASQSLYIFERPTFIPRCLNNGQDISDVGFTTRGELYVMDLEWLPDSSGFLTVNSYMGDGAQGSGSDCIFNYSRLRLYSVRYE